MSHHPPVHGQVCSLSSADMDGFHLHLAQVYVLILLGFRSHAFLFPALYRLDCVLSVRSLCSSGNQTWRHRHVTVQHPTTMLLISPALLLSTFTCAVLLCCTSFILPYSTAVRVLSRKPKRSRVARCPRISSCMFACWCIWGVSTTACSQYRTVLLHTISCGVCGWVYFVNRKISHSPACFLSYWNSIHSAWRRKLPNPLYIFSAHRTTDRTSKTQKVYALFWLLESV